MLRSPKWCVHKSSHGLSPGWKETRRSPADRLHGYLRKGSVSPGISSAVVTGNLNPHWSDSESEFVLLFFVFCFFLTATYRTNPFSHEALAYTWQLHPNKPHCLLENKHTDANQQIYSQYTHHPRRKEIQFSPTGSVSIFLRNHFFPVSPVSRQLPLMLASNIQG